MIVVRQGNRRVCGRGCAMASVLPQLKCAICGGPLDALDNSFRASGKFLPAGDPLAHFCNAPLHWSCYADWPDRPRFARHHVEAWVQANRTNPFWWFIYRDDLVYVSANPAPPVEEASVRLYGVGSDIRVPLPRWKEWLAAAKRVTPRLHALELAALAEVLPTLRAKFPDDHAVVDAIDPDEKRPRPK